MAWPVKDPYTKPLPAGSSFGKERTKLQNQLAKLCTEFMFELNILNISRVTWNLGSCSIPFCGKMGQKNTSIATNQKLRSKI
jgi:hypothetical protein